MKYVVIQKPNGSEFVVFCVAPQTHKQLAAAWCRDTADKPVAAGFCEFLGTGSAIVFGHSVSLNLRNRGTPDATLITMFYVGTVEMARRNDAVADRLAERFGSPAP